MPGITSGCSFGSTQKLQNNQDVWDWIYWVKPLRFQMGISLQLDDAHNIKWRKIKPPSFPQDKQNLKTWKYSARRPSEGIMCCLWAKKELLQKHCTGLLWLDPGSSCPHSPARRGPESTGHRHPASSTPAAPGIYHGISTTDPKDFARHQHLIALL